MMYDVAVIGSGPGGYACAIKSAQLGLKVAVVEKQETFGGTCLNIGCIPSKALLHASERFHEASHSFESLGICIDKPQVDLKKMMQHKNSVVEANVRGISFLFEKNQIKSFLGVGRILDGHKVSITHSEGKVTEISAKNIVIATGSETAGIPGVPVEIDEDIIVSSTGALSLSKIPNDMVIVGAGVIGLELGSVWSRLGSRVTVIEFQDRILPGADEEISRQAERVLSKQGLIFKLGARVIAVEKKKKQAVLSFEVGEFGKSETCVADVVLIATGRKAFTENLGLVEAKIAMDKDRIQVDALCSTNVSSIYALGDVVRGSMLAHKAEDEGLAVAERIAGKKSHINYDVIPNVVYTSPEIAWVGKTMQQLQAEGIAFKTGKFPFMANGRARATLQTEGFVKILVEQDTDRVLGAHILGAGAGEMIHEIAVLMEFGGSSEDLARICHAHPTLSEAVREAAWAAFFKPIHI